MDRRRMLALLFVVSAIGFFAYGSFVFASSAGYQRCQKNSNCTVGEYVFDNDYNPVSTNVCTIKITDPGDTVVVNDAATDYRSDGWHSYTYAAGATEGIYRGLMCCQVASDDQACIDESFVVGETLEDIKQEADLIKNANFDFIGSADSGSATTTLVDAELSQPDDYWNSYTVQMLSGDNFGQERSVTDFVSSTHTLTLSSAMPSTIAQGDQYILKREERLVSRIWSATTRTLTSAANVAGDIWSYSNRTLTSAANVAGDIWNVLASSLTTDGSIGKQLATNVDTTISSRASQTSLNTLQSDVTAIASTVDLIYTDTQAIHGHVDTLLSKWDTYSAADIMGDLDTVKSRIGVYTDSSSTETLFGRSKFLQEKWGTQTAQAIYTAANDALTKITETQTELGYHGKSQTAYDDIIATKTSAANLEDLVGNPDDGPLVATVFGKVHSVQDKVDTLDQMKTDLLTEINENQALIEGLNDISAADVWGYSSRSLTSGVSLTDPTQVWDVAKANLDVNNSIGKHIVDNLDTTISSRSTLTAADVWTNATRTLTDYSTSTIATAVWANATRTLTSYGNDITASDVWNILSSTLTTEGSIGKQLATNIDTTLSSRATQSSVDAIQSDATYIRSKADSIYTDMQAIHGHVDTLLSKWDTYSAADIIGDLNTVKSRIGVYTDTSATETLFGRSKFLQEKWGTQTAQAIYDKANDTLTKVTAVQTELGYNGKSTTAYDDLQAAKTSAAALEDLVGDPTDGPLVATVFGKVHSVQDKVDTLDQMEADIIAEVDTKIDALNDISAADVWSYSSRALTSGVSLTDPTQVWDVAKTDLDVSNSIGKHIVDNLDTTISSRSTLTAAQVWQNATRTLTDYNTSTLAAAVWQNATRTLTSYGNDITAADVWNVLSNTLTTEGSIGKQLATNVDATTSSRATQTSVNALQSDVTYIRGKVDSIYTDTQTIASDTADLLAKWNTLSAQDIIDSLDTVKSRIGVYTDSSAAETLFGRSKFLQEKWGTQTAQAIYDKANDTLTKATAVQSELGFNGKGTTAYDEMVALQGDSTALQTLVGTASDGPTELTLFGKVHSVQDTVNTLDQMKADIIAEVNENQTLIANMDAVTAADVWSYANRTLTSGVSLSDPTQVWDVAKTDLTVNNSIGKHIVDNLDAAISSRSVLTATDVWQNATRSLTDYSTSAVATAVWANATRTLSSYGNDITAADVWNVLSSSLNTVGSIGKQLATNVDTTVSSRATQMSVDTLQSDVTYIRGKADSIYNDTQDIAADADTLVSKWGSYSAQNILDNLTTVKDRIGTASDTSSTETLFGRAKFIQEKWGAQSAQAIYDKANNALATIAAVQTELGYNGKSSTAYDSLVALKADSGTLKNLVGTSDDNSSTATLFGRVRQVKEKTDMLDSIQADIDGLNLTMDNTEVLNQLETISTDVQSVSTDVSGLDDMMTVDRDTLKESKDIKNKLIDLRTVINIDKLLIKKDPIVKTYYEWGSVILKMVIVNPADIAQTVNFKTALPKEVKPEYIMKKDDTLKLAYDAEAERWDVSEDLQLGAGQSVTRLVEVKDIWVIPIEEIESLRNQVNDLVKPLEGTAYFAQGTTLKNDSIARLDKISWVQKEETATPEEHIVKYRDSLNDLNAVKQNIESLNRLVTDTSNKNFLQGNIFGVSTVMTWAIILMITVGVAILMLLFFILMKRNRELSTHVRTTLKEAREAALAKRRARQQAIEEAELKEEQEAKKLKREMRWIIIFLTVMILGLLGFIGYRYFVAKRGIAQPVQAAVNNTVDISDLQAVKMRTKGE